MASLEVRHNRGKPTYRVIWRENGTRVGQTFTDRRSAEQFQKLVEGHGNHWPKGWTPGGGFSAPTESATPAFGDWAVRTINARAAANDRTRADYLRDIRLHLIPAFGDCPVDEITREAVGQWLIDMSRSGAAPKTIKNIHDLASSVMNDAVDVGLVSRNVFKGAASKLPTVKTEEMVFLTRQEFDWITASMAAEVKVPKGDDEVRYAARPHYVPLTKFAVLTGLRWSELTALTVADVNVFGRATATVNKAWKRQPDNTMSLGEPKSRRSRRTISINTEAVELLIPLIADREPTDRLFTSVQGYTVHHGNYRNKVWLEAITKAKILYGLKKSPRIHDLRHTHISWLIAAGVDLVSVQRRAGHESIQTTIDRYGHLQAESDDRINAALDGTASYLQISSESAAREGVSTG